MILGIYRRRCLQSPSCLLPHTHKARFADRIRLRDDQSNANGTPREIKNDFAKISPSYRTPQYAIVLAHGLLGFNELHVVGNLLPGVKYWRGITDAFVARGIETITASVPASATIEERATRLGEVIEQRAGGKSVNIIAHSMGGLDARYMISQLRPKNVHVKSLTTIATPRKSSKYRYNVATR